MRRATTDRRGALPARMASSLAQASRRAAGRGRRRAMGVVCRYEALLEPAIDETLKRALISGQGGAAAVSHTILHGALQPAAVLALSHPVGASSTACAVGSRVKQQQSTLVRQPHVGINSRCIAQTIRFPSNCNVTCIILPSDSPVPTCLSGGARCSPNSIIDGRHPGGAVSEHLLCSVSGPGCAALPLWSHCHGADAPAEADLCSSPGGQRGGSKQGVLGKQRWTVIVVAIIVSSSVSGSPIKCHHHQQQQQRCQGA